MQPALSFTLRSVRDLVFAIAVYVIWTEGVTNFVLIAMGGKL